MDRKANVGRVLIVGGSMGGLFAANLLHRAGWDVHVVERVAEELSGRGAGLATHAALIDDLKRAGVTIDDTLGVPVRSRVTLGRAGDLAGEIELPQIFSGWSRLYHLLRGVLPASAYTLGRGVARVEQDGKGVTAIFDDGSREHADLLIAADGIRSGIRAQLLPEAMPKYAGYVGWRGLVDEGDLSAQAHAALFEHLGFCLPAGEQMLGYPVPGKDNTCQRGKRRYNFVWYRPADERGELARLLTDDSGKRHDFSIPPPLIARQVVRDVRRAAEEVLAPQFAEIVHKTKDPFFQPIYDLESSRIVVGRVALLGDAAFVARPHCGMGVTKAADDAAELVDSLDAHAGDVDAGLARYDKRRVEFGRFIVNHARELGAYMQATAKGEVSVSRSADAVMRETAVAPAFAYSA